MIFSVSMPLTILWKPNFELNTKVQLTDFRETLIFIVNGISETSENGVL